MLVVDVELFKLEVEAEEVLVDVVWEGVVDVVLLFVVDVVVEENSRTLSLPESATQRLPPRSKATPHGL